MCIKILIQINSYGRACNNVLATGHSEVPQLTNNLVGFCSYGILTL
jgi:hypothetical protein